MNQDCRGVLLGNSKSLWTAINIAKDIGTNENPQNIYNDGRLDFFFFCSLVSGHDGATCFDDF